MNVFYNFNVLMIIVRAVSTQISVLDLRSSVEVDSLGMALRCRNV